MRNLHPIHNSITNVWPYGSGKMVQLFRHHPWEQTALGPLSNWPQSLKTSVELMLAMKQPACIGYGKQFNLLYNDAYIDLIGAEHPAALGKPYFELWPAPHAPNKSWLEMIMSGESVFIENQLFIPPGKETTLGDRWMTYSWTPLRDEAGNVVGFYGTAIEITHSVLPEKGLRRSERRFKAIANLVPDLLWSNDQKGETYWYNDRWLNYTGQTHEEASDYGWLSVIHPDDREQSLKSFQDAVDRCCPLRQEHRIRNASGQYRWFLIQAEPLPDEQSNIVQWFGAATDIHDRKLSEELLKASNVLLEQQVNERMHDLVQAKEFLQTTINSSTYTFQGFKAVRNASGKIIDFRWTLTNKAWNDYNPDVIGKSLLEESPGVVPTGLFDKFVQVTETGITIDHEQYYNHEQFDGWFHQILVKMDNGFLMNTEDITQRKLAQLEVQQSRELLQAVIDSSLEMIQVFKAIRNQQGEIVDFEWLLNNHVAQKYYGNVTGKRLLVHNPGVVEEGIFNSFKEVTQTGIAQQHERHYVHEQFNGWFYQSVVKLNDGVATSTGNTTARKLAEQDLKLQKERLQSVFDTSLIGMSILNAERDDNGTILDFRLMLVNKELERETHRTNLIGKLYTQEYPGIKASGLFDMMLRVMESGQPEGTEYFYPHEGFNKWFSCMFVKMDDGLVATNLDITERKHAEEERLKNLALLEQAEKVAQTGSWEYDILAARFTWSDGMYHLFELPVGTEVKPDTYLSFVTPESKPRVLRIIHHIKTGQAAFEESVNFNVNGRIKTLSIKGTVFYDKRQVAFKLLGIDMDITAAVEAEKKLRNIEAEQQQEIFRNTLNTQEEERKRIAESLHNGLGQMLYGVKLSLHQMDLKPTASPAHNEQVLRQAEELITDCIKESRRISHELTPAILEDFGLKEAVQDICHKLSGQVIFSCSFTGIIGKMDRYLETAIYRMVQELMMNVVKHADATHSNIKIEKTKKAVLVIVEDNGKGLTNRKSKDKGIGLQTIRNRVALLGGKFQASSAAQSGTTISITLPRVQLEQLHSN
ncbi:PAS domain S-box protein [Mucilaginibacter lacusdianchii]|uniref:PAS domain S-box protein n=1 Tax=Mucilaginibacter lacusdianchii TaxID=2684211 RepID=UPI00131D0A23|nr:PAS domain S-box protein [Mucilaginibacter sp. JXJ CY 39]